MRVFERGLELYAEGETRHQISKLRLCDAFRPFFELRDPDGYLAIMTILGSDPLVELALVCGNTSPRRWGYRYCSAQVRDICTISSKCTKVGRQGLFLILTKEPSDDIAVPGAGYTFGQLQLPLALGDFESLEWRHKPVLHLHLTQEVTQGLGEVEQSIRQALEHACTAAR